MALALSCALVPAAAFAAEGDEVAGEAPDEVAGVADGPADGSSDGVAGGSPDGPIGGVPAGNAAGSALGDGEAAAGGASTLAAALAGRPTAFVNADVALDGEPVVGSFTVEGLTFAVTEGADVELVGVSEVAEATPRRVVASSQGLSAPDALPDLGSTPATSETEADASALLLPESVAYNGVEYAFASIGAYAFYLSGVTSVELPASVVDVDERAFRSSDVASVAVAEGNPAYASCDGVLYDAALTRLLLIPEGRSEGVRIPYTAEEVAAAAFSHASSVAAISVDADSPTYSSEDGLLYSADGTVLLRVPAGAADITIREGCTTIAAGAMEGCAKLASIAAPATVASISPDVFANVPTVSLPALAAADDAEGSSQADEAEGAFGSEVPTSPQPPSASSAEASSPAGAQLTALVALSTTDDDLPETEPSSIQVSLPEGADDAAWISLGFAVMMAEAATANLDSFGTYAAESYWMLRVSDSDAGYILVTSTNISGVTTGVKLASRPIMTGAGSVTVTGSSNGNWSWVGGSANAYGYVAANPGYSYKGWSTSQTGTPQSTFGRTYEGGTVNQWAIFAPNPYTIAFDPNGDGASVEPASVQTVYDAQTALPTPVRPGYRFEGWDTQADGSGTRYQDTASKLTTASGATVTLHAQWEPYVLDFETSEEPGDENCPGEEKPSVTVPDIIDDAGKRGIEDPKRPGYVFQGWVIPNAESTEAIDQDLVYQDETDGKWYVDASKLPDYADESGKVELTARWTSVISVDVPSAVTFYADVVTEGQESREGAASSAFGQNKVASQSEVDLRIVGLESNAVETQGSTLGADSILKKTASATPSSSTQKLFSLYPTSKALTADDLQDPDAVSAAKPTDAVDFALDDILLEKSFAADKFTIPAGDTLNLGYRLNLSETGTELDYDKLSTLDEGQSASIANISYCFAAKMHFPTATGSKDDPLYIEYEGRVYGLQDIKDSAECIAQHGAASPCFGLYKAFLDAQVMTSGNPGSGPYFQLKVKGAVSGYLDLQLIGICQDAKSDGTGNAGLTFQMRDIYAYGNAKSTMAGGGTFTTVMDSKSSGAGTRGWNAMPLRNTLRTTFMECLDPALQSAIVTVKKNQQLYGGMTTLQLQSTTETIFLPSLYEVHGAAFELFNESEQYANEGYAPFQYLAYQGNNGLWINVKAVKKYNGSTNYWWLRSAIQGDSSYFCSVADSGTCKVKRGTNVASGVAPAFCL